MDSKTNAVFLTGATGFVGMELLARYLERTDRRVYALVRGADDHEVQARMQRTLLGLFGPASPYADRVVAVRGDVTRPGLGVPGGLDWLAGEVNEIVHSAASVSFELELQAARAINLDGTRRVLEFAERCQARGGLRRVSHISTAFVAGEHDGCFSEDELDVGQRFRNSYEQSKFEAECMIARSYTQLPITIFRPASSSASATAAGRARSTSSTGRCARSRAAPTSRCPRAATRPSMSCRSTTSPTPCSRSATRVRPMDLRFHLTAGAHVGSVSEVIELATSFFKRPVPHLIEPTVYRRVHPLLVRSAPDERSRRALIRSEVFFPYFTMQVGFDNRRARVALRGSGIATTPLASYFEQLMQFALAAEWGRRHITRASASVRTAPLLPRSTRAAPARARRASQPDW